MLKLKTSLRPRLKLDLNEQMVLLDNIAENYASRVHRHLDRLVEVRARAEARTLMASLVPAPEPTVTERACIAAFTPDYATAD